MHNKQERGEEGRCERKGGHGKEESSRPKWSESILLGLFHTESLQICITKCAYVPTYRHDLKKDREGGERRKGGKRRIEGNAGESGGSSLKPEKPRNAAARLRAERGVAHFSSDTNLQGTEVCWKNG